MLGCAVILTSLMTVVIHVGYAQILPETTKEPHYEAHDVVRRGAYPLSATCNNSILLAFGRSATSTITGSLMYSTPLEYCHNIKEFFRWHSPNMQELVACNLDSRAGLLMHIKPDHVRPGKYDDVLPTFKEFFPAAKKTGFVNVFGTFRHNILERAISSYELVHNVHERHRPPFNWQAAINAIYNQTSVFNEAWAAAAAVGLRMHYYTFTDITQNFCPTATKIVNFIGCNGFDFQCKEVDAHQKTSHVKQPLSERIGSLAVEELKHALANTPYEWMLDTSINEWPKDKPRPLSSIPIPERTAADYNR